MSKGRTLDYIDSNINRASRLCDMARSFGIVIDAEDFSEMKKRFSRMLSGKGALYFTIYPPLSFFTDALWY